MKYVTNSRLCDIGKMRSQNQCYLHMTVLSVKIISPPLFAVNPTNSTLLSLLIGLKVYVAIRKCMKTCTYTFFTNKNLQG
jgi:hypothetical protein